jgi:hypothetical protein
MSVKSLRISIPLNTSNPSQNIFNVSKLRKLHTEKLVGQSPSQSVSATSKVDLDKIDDVEDTVIQIHDSDSESDQEQQTALESSTKVVEKRPKRSKKADPEHEV